MLLYLTFQYNDAVYAAPVMSQENEAALAENDEASVDVRIGKEIAGSITQAHYHTQDEHGMVVFYSPVVTLYTGIHFSDYKVHYFFVSGFLDFSSLNLK